MDGWELLQPLVVRTTGFPIDLLERLRFVRTTALVREILDCEAKIAGLQRQLMTDSLPVMVRQAYTQGDQAALARMSKWRRAISRRRVVEGLEHLSATYHQFLAPLEGWNALIEQHAALIDAGQAAWQRELAELRRQLREIAGDLRFQEAIFLSNPDMYAGLQRYLGSDMQEKRTSDVRKFERRLIFYLQRFCVKNETQSFFGPINYGQLDPEQPFNIRVQRSAGSLRRRVVFPSQWMVEALATRIGAEAELRPFLRPRRSTLCTFTAGRLSFPASGKTISFDPVTERLFHLADGRHTVKELAALTGEDWTSTWRRIEQLQRQKALITQIIIPSDSSDPLAYLQQWVAGLPEDLPARTCWLARLDELHCILDDFATADLARRVHLLARLEADFTALCGDTGRRGAGAMYADRLLLFEECLGDLEHCTLGGELAQAITRQLQAVLRLSQAYGRLLAKRDQRRAKATWQQLPSVSQTVPFLAYLREVNQYQALAVSTAADETDELDRFLADLHVLVRARTDGRRAHLRGDELPIPPLPSEPDTCLYCSPDLMIAAPSQSALQEGVFEIVLGEVHPQPLVWVFPTAYFLDDGGASLGGLLWEKLMEQPGGEAAAQLVFGRKNKIYPYALPGAAIEVRPHAPDCRAIPLAAVHVCEQHGSLRLRADDRDLRLYTPLHRREPGRDPLAPFAFPAVQPPLIDFGEHTPRIQIDQVIYQRERWSIAGATLCVPQAHGFELFLEMWRRKEQLGLPDELFVRAPQEPKPIYIDLTNHFLVELLQHVAGQSQHLTLTEMLPNSRQLWLEGADGRYCCEFRTMAIGRLPGM